MSLAARLRAYFFAGVLITAPVSITAYLAWLFISTVDREVKALLPAAYWPEAYLPVGIPGIGVVVALLGLTLIGMFTAGFVGRMVNRLFDAILIRMPVVSGIYSALKQIMETVLAKKSQAFREVVLIEYPRPGLHSIAFVSGVAAPQVGAVLGKAEDEILSVFVPTTPNPTSGFLLFLPRAEVITLPISVDEGLKYIVSTGLVVPGK
ncbi:MAG: DUF502 domain-containing protein [Alphaproteobacteria bacterium]|nr:DUF502 domain-containing protein [Alphaproteobacteria bacterium]